MSGGNPAQMKAGKPAREMISLFKSLNGKVTRVRYENVIAPNL